MFVSVQVECTGEGDDVCWWPCGMGWFVVKSWVAAWRCW